MMLGGKLSRLHGKETSELMCCFKNWQIKGKNGAFILPLLLRNKLNH